MPLDQPVVQETWQSPTLLNNWANFGGTFNSAGFWLDSVGVVHFRGVIFGGVSNSQIFSLPIGYRPTATEALMTWSFSSSMGYQVGRVDVSADGAVRCTVGSSTGVTGAFFLDGLTFRAA